MPQGLRSGAAWLACAGQAEIDDFLGGLSRNALLSLPWLFEFWALPHQIAPAGAWKTWAVMVEGESGILACTPPDRRPKWLPSRGLLEWPNGARAEVFSAHEPESLRGPQFDTAWADELAKWPKEGAAWDQLQFALRLGEMPQQVVTTTPKNVEVLKAVLANPSTVVTHAPTEANRAHLAASFLDEVQARYGGTSLGRQELEGLLIDDAEDALWSKAMIRAAQKQEGVTPSRVVVAVDPPVTANKTSDECGIVVVGADTRGASGAWRAVVLADRSLKGASPDGWARAAVAAMAEFGADRLVVEVNQGGDLVAGVVRQVDPMVAIREVRASRGKWLRAEPVAALYEQGRVAHARGLGQLEAQLMKMTRSGWQGRGSPDRLDALVWGLTELMVDPAGRQSRPGMRWI